MAVAVALSSLALAACGASSTAHSAGNAGGYAPVRVMESNEHDLTEVGADAGTALGNFTKAGLSVKISTSEQVAQAMAAGTVDIGLSSPNRVVAAIHQGLPATIVGATMPWWDQYVITAAGSSAKSVADLKGKKFGVSSFASAGSYATVKIAEQQGWTKDDYKVVTLGSLQGLVAGLKGGTIDAFLWSALPAYSLENSGDARVLGSVKDLVGPNPLVIAYVRNDFLKQHPETVRKFFEIFYASTQQLKQDPKLTEKLFVQSWGANDQIITKVLDSELPLVTDDGQISDQMFSGIVEATKFTVQKMDSLTPAEVKKTYKYWKTI